MTANHEDHQLPSSESPVVDDVRTRAMSISARYGHSLRRYAAHLAELEAQQRERLVSQPRVERPDEPARRSKPAA
jgi:phosphoserine phosphatase